MNVEISSAVLEALPCRVRSITAANPREQLCAQYFAFLTHLLQDRARGKVDLEGIVAAHLIMELQRAAFDRSCRRASQSGADLRRELWSIQMSTQMSLEDAARIDDSLSEAVQISGRSLADFFQSDAAEAFVRMLPEWTGSIADLVELVEAIFPSADHAEDHGSPGTERESPAAQATTQRVEPPRVQDSQRHRR